MLSYRSRQLSLLTPNWSLGWPPSTRPLPIGSVKETMLTRGCSTLRILLALLLLASLYTSDAHGRPKESGVTRFAAVDMQRFSREDAMNLMRIIVENQVDVLGILHYSSGDAKVASRVGFDLQQHKYHAEVMEEHDVLLASPRKFIKLRAFLAFQAELGRHILIGGHAPLRDAQLVHAVLAVAARDYMLEEPQATDPDYVFFRMNEMQKPRILYPTHLEGVVKGQGTLDDERFVFADLGFPSAKKPLRLYLTRGSISRHLWWILILNILSLGLLIFLIMRARRAAQ